MATLVACTLATASASAAVINNVNIVDVSSQLVQNFTRGAGLLIDGSGLNPDGSHSSTPDGTMWLNTGTTNCCGGFSEVNSPGAGQDNVNALTFDLGQQHFLNSIRIWNYNEVNLPNRGAQEVELLVSNDNITFTSLGVKMLNQAPGNALSDFSQTFAANTEARFVKLDIVNGLGGDNGFVGLSEVQFDGTPLRQAPLLIPNVTIANVSSEIRAPFNRDSDFLVNGAGLNANDSHSVAPDGTMWLTNGVGFGGPDDRDPFVVFNLGQSVKLDSIQVWNYNEATNSLTSRGVATMEVLVGNSAAGPFTSIGVFDLIRGAQRNTFDISQILPVNNATTGQFVMFDILSNFNGTQFPNNLNDVDFNFVGLSEVRFFAAPPVPEPATIALLGLAGLGLLRRRRHASCGADRHWRIVRPCRLQM